MMSSRSISDIISQFEPEKNEEEKKEDTSFHLTKILKNTIKGKKIDTGVALNLTEARASFNFVLKEHRNGVIFMGS